LNLLVLTTVGIAEEDVGEDVEEDVKEDAKEDAKEDVVEETIGVMIRAALVMKAMTYFLYYFFSPYYNLASIKSL